MIKAVIFDMDGVISDTQRMHSAIEVALLKEVGIDVSAEYISKNYSGIPDRDFFGKIMAEHNLPVDTDSLIIRKWERMMSAAPGNITGISGAVELINKLKAAGLKLGVASSSPPQFIELVLFELGIREYFQSITSTTEVASGKPNPDIFLLAAKKLNMAPGECAVIEDAISGMTAAKKAGMACIGLVSDDGDYPADFTVRNLGELNAEIIINLKSKKNGGDSSL